MLFKTYEEGGHRLYICSTSESDRDQVCKYMELQGKNYYKPLSFPTLFYTIVSGDREENQIREFLNKQFSDFGLIIDTQCNKVFCTILDILTIQIEKWEPELIDKKVLSDVRDLIRGMV